MQKQTWNKEFFKAYRGGIAPYLTEKETSDFYTSALLRDKKEQDEGKVKHFVSEQLKELRQLDEKIAIIWLQ